MTIDARRQEILNQPCAFKYVYAPEGAMNPHYIVRGPDGWHLFYNRMDDWTVIQHATSDDLLIWAPQRCVLRTGGAGDWDEGELLVNGMIEHEGRWYMFCAGRPTPRAARRIGVKVSDDLWTWRNFPADGGAVFTPDPGWSGWHEDAGAQWCKDSHIIRYEDGFLFHYATRNRHGQSCVAVAASKDLLHWEDGGPVVTTDWMPDDHIGPAGFEVPRVIEHDGRFFLFAMHFFGYQFAVGQTPFSFGDPIVMGPWHAATFFETDTGWIISHVAQLPGVAGHRLGRRKPWRGLFLAGLDWSSGYPFVTDLRHVLEGWPEEGVSGG